MLVKRRAGIPVIPNVFDDIFRDWSIPNISETNNTQPTVNILENEDEFKVEVAAPGMNKKDFNIDFDNDVLTISSEKIEDNEDTTDEYIRKEYSYQSFKRSFRLPENVADTEKIAATYKNGELVISIPKREELKPKPARLIEVH